MTKVFLSSTFADLKKERTAVQSAVQRISAHFIGMEYFGSFSNDPVEECKRKVSSADYVILVLARRYGFVPPGLDKSITEIEYDTARENEIPVLAYFQESEEGVDKDSSDFQMLEAFKSRVQLRHGVSDFDGPADLAWKVIADLSREMHAASQHIGPLPDRVVNGILVDRIEHNITELIKLLEQRAIVLRSKLETYYKYAEVSRFLTKFNELHWKHISALKDGNIILAHELLGQIHELFFAVRVGRVLCQRSSAVNTSSRRSLLSLHRS